MPGNGEIAIYSKAQGEDWAHSSPTGASNWTNKFVGVLQPGATSLVQASVNPGVAGYYRTRWLVPSYN